MQPNIVWIMTDHQRTDSLSCYGSTWCSTPNIDRLAGQGVRFAQCTSQSPVCVPSRTAQLTGRYAHACGVLENQVAVAPRGEWLTDSFRDAGYQVVNFGKLHCAGHKQRNPFPWHEHGPGPGAAGATMSDLGEGYDASEHDIVTISVSAPSFDRLMVGGRFPLPPEQNEPELLARRLDRFLHEEARPPFLVRVSISAPHTPILPASGYYGRTDPSLIDVPLPSETLGARIPRYEAEVIRSHQGYGELSEEQVAQARANYYDLCTEIDDVVGSIVDSVVSHGHGDTTIITLNSDHGTLLGEFGLAQNRTLFDPVVQVPFIMTTPALLPAGRVVDDPVELIDLFPTLMGLAGMDVPHSVQGRNLIPQIMGEAAHPDRPTFSEIDYAQALPKAVRERGSHRVMVRHRNWKMFCSLNDGGYGEDGALYDLGEDPHELRNLFDAPDRQDAIADLKCLIERWQRMV